MKTLFDDIETGITVPDAIENIAQSGCLSCPRGVWRKEQNLKITVAKGNPNAKIMVVGKSPGIKDSEIGQPYSFGSMDMLKAMLGSVGIDPLKDTLLTNGVFCPSNNDSTPSLGDIKTCNTWFNQLIAAANPTMFIALGTTAYLSLTHKKIQMKDVSGHTEPFETVFGAPCFVVYHPAYFLRGIGDYKVEKQETYKTLRAAKQWFEARGLND